MEEVPRVLQAMVATTSTFVSILGTIEGREVTTLEGYKTCVLTVAARVCSHWHAQQYFASSWQRRFAPLHRHSKAAEHHHLHGAQKPLQVKIPRIWRLWQLPAYGRWVSMHVEQLTQQKWPWALENMFQLVPHHVKKVALSSSFRNVATSSAILSLGR